MNNRGTNEHSVTVGLPADASPPRFVLVDSDGKWRQVFYHARAAAEYAKHLWPDQEQDPDRTGKGWDIQIAS